MERKKIFIVEDHPITREGLKVLLESEETLEVCGEAESEREALEKLSSLQPDLLIVDITLKGSSGLDLIQYVRKKYPRLPILVLSMHEEEIYAQRVLSAGALGYVMKHEDSRCLLEAVHTVLKGEIYLSEKMAKKILYQMARGKFQKGGIESLSNRELEVFRLIGEGLGVKEIAERLFLSVKTVETYRERIKEKLGIETAAELTQFAIQWCRKWE